MAQEEIRIPTHQWYQFLDVFTRIDELLVAILKVQMAIAQRLGAPIPGVEVTLEDVVETLKEQATLVTPSTDYFLDINLVETPSADYQKLVGYEVTGEYTEGRLIELAWVPASGSEDYAQFKLEMDKDVKFKDKKVLGAVSLLFDGRKKLRPKEPINLYVKSDGTNTIKVFGILYGTLIK